MPTPVKLQPVEIAVDLDGDAVRHTSLLLDLLSSTVGAPVSGDDEIGRGSDAIGFQDVHWWYRRRSRCLSGRHRRQLPHLKRDVGDLVDGAIALVERGEGIHLDGVDEPVARTLQRSGCACYFYPFEGLMDALLCASRKTGWGLDEMSNRRDKLNPESLNVFWVLAAIVAVFGLIWVAFIL
jgi:hypothetical protein